MKRDIILPDYVRDFMKVFVNTGFEIYLVGGAVRDLLLEKKTKNFDFTTNATPEKIQKMFEKTHYNNIYGTVTIPVEITDGISDGRTRGVTGTGSPGVGEERLEKLIFEVTPYRREGKYKDFRHPEKIDWAKTLEEDVARRDFTINALAHDGKKLIDYVGGMQDLGKKLVRAVGEPKARFCEDALRLIRAVRIASELGFMIEEHTRAAITRNAPLIQHVSWERVGSEMLKIISSDHPAEGVLFLKNTGLLKLILPELDATFDVAQKSPGRHHIYDVGTHLVETLRHCPSKNTIARFAALIHDVGKVETQDKNPKSGTITFYNHEVVGAKQAEKIAERLRLSKQQKKQLVTMVRHHMFSVTEKQSDKAIRRFIRKVGPELVPEMLAMRVGDRIGSGARPTSWRTEEFKKRLIEVQKQPFSVHDLKINGNDVMKKIDIKPGPQVGKILQKLFEEVEDKKLENKRSALLDRLKEFSL